MNKIGVPQDKVKFSVKARDSNGRGFSWRGEIYRAIPADRVGLSERLYNGGVVDELVKKGLLIDTERTTLQING